jgi:hypothetical protein
MVSSNLGGLSTMGSPNSRKIPRLEFLEPVPLSPSQETSGKIILIENEARGIDISSQGLGITTSSTLKKGDVWRISLPARTEGAVLPVFPGVVWVNRQNKEYRAGLQFLSKFIKRMIFTNKYNRLTFSTPFLPFPTHSEGVITWKKK